jgi:hypothetical protein
MACDQQQAQRQGLHQSLPMSFERSAIAICARNSTHHHACGSIHFFHSLSVFLIA